MDQCIDFSLSLSLSHTLSLTHSLSLYMCFFFTVFLTLLSGLHRPQLLCPRCVYPRGVPLSARLGRGQLRVGQGHVSWPVLRTRDPQRREQHLHLRPELDRAWLLLGWVAQCRPWCNSWALVVCIWSDVYLCLYLSSCGLSSCIVPGHTKARSKRQKKLIFGGGIC